MPSLDGPRPVRLRAIQKLVGGAIMRRLTPGYSMQKTWVDGRPMDAVAQTVIRPNDRLTSFDRLEIYNRQYWFRLIDIMHDDFPGLRAVVGKGRFQKLIIEYLAARPSQSFTLRNLGQFLIAFLEQRRDLTRPHTSAALEMARLEGAATLAFDNAALTPITLQDLQKTPPDQLRMALQPHLTLLHAKHAVDDYLILVKQKVSAAGPDAIPLIRARPRPQKTFLAIHRHDNRVFYKPLDPAAFRLLSALAQGETLLDAMTSAFIGRSAPTPEQIRDWFAAWTSLGWFCRRAV